MRAVGGKRRRCFSDSRVRGKEFVEVLIPQIQQANYRFPDPFEFFRAQRPKAGFEARDRNGLNLLQVEDARTFEE